MSVPDHDLRKRSWWIAAIIVPAAGALVTAFPSYIDLIFHSETQPPADPGIVAHLPEPSPSENDVSVVPDPARSPDDPGIVATPAPSLPPGGGNVVGDPGPLQLPGGGNVVAEPASPPSSDDGNVVEASTGGATGEILAMPGPVAPEPAPAAVPPPEPVPAGIPMSVERELSFGIAHPVCGDRLHIRLAPSAVGPSAVWLQEPLERKLLKGETLRIEGCSLTFLDVKRAAGEVAVLRTEWREDD